MPRSKNWTFFSTPNIMSHAWGGGANTLKGSTTKWCTSKDPTTCSGTHFHDLSPYTRRNIPPFSTRLLRVSSRAPILPTSIEYAPYIASTTPEWTIWITKTVPNSRSHTKSWGRMTSSQWILVTLCIAITLESETNSTIVFLMGLSLYAFPVRQRTKASLCARSSLVSVMTLLAWDIEGIIEHTRRFENCSIGPICWDTSGSMWVNAWSAYALNHILVGNEDDWNPTNLHYDVWTRSRWILS